MAFSVREFITSDGRIPFREWITALDVTIRARIQVRILRFESGNLGDHKSVGNGVWEARMPFGSGYRLYFGMDEVIADQGYQTRAEVLARIPGGGPTWQEELGIGMKGLRRI